MTLKNQKGQMAIFIALFFQVLFVFFAMAINVGLVIHDKINLQNSVDLAAYYGATKQAEILNQMAHINYQMRQNYKLLVWRYRVLGTLGLNIHPLRLGGSPLPDINREGTIKPFICVANDYWKEYKESDMDAVGFCRTPNVSIPSIPSVSGGVGFVPGFNALTGLVTDIQQNLLQRCEIAGAINWFYAALILSHFRVDGFMRKGKIKRLALNLSQGNDFKDLRNESVEQGVRNTFEKNLTESNFSGIKNFQYFNSMGQGQCSSHQFWLPEIKINPVIMYLKLQAIGGGPNPPCTGKPVFNRRDSTDPQLIFPHNHNAGHIPAYAQDPELKTHWEGEPTNELRSSIGFEKNPWCVVYSGVTASTEVRKPFSPGSGTVELKAQGFAKPFGGRLGPWYGKLWPRGASMSQAGRREDMVDQLLPSRGTSSSWDTEGDIANHSRYPGDTLGLKSGLAISAMLPKFHDKVPPPTTSYQLALETYSHLGKLDSLKSTGDSLARNGPTFPANQRDYELAATAPDVFDAFYYSIEPDYFHNYFSDAATNNGAQFSNDQKIYDFGSAKQGGHPGTTKNFSVLEQVSHAKGIYNPIYNPGVKYIIEKWEHLLTSWHQKGVANYDLDESQFGKCSVPVGEADDLSRRSQFPTTGNCISGGRTGYSVKNVSMDFLLSEEHELSGRPGNKGAILNPPSF